MPDILRRHKIGGAIFLSCAQIPEAASAVATGFSLWPLQSLAGYHHFYSAGCDAPSRSDPAAPS
jgi:hypothetical protein